MLLQFVRGDTREPYLLAARENGGKQRPGVRGHQYENNVARRLLEHLQQRRGALLPHPLRVLDDEHLDVGLDGLVERVQPYLAYLIHRDVLPRGPHHGHVRMLFSDDPPADVALTTTVIGAQQGGGKCAGHYELPHRGWSGKEVGVVDVPLLDRSLQA